MRIATDRNDALSNGIIGVTAALMTVGVVAVASAGAGLDRPWSETTLWSTTAGRQIIFAAVGWVTMLAVARIGPRLRSRRGAGWRRPELWLLAATLLGLALVLIPGVGIERNGARRWLPLGPPDLGLRFQPSELAKVALIVFLSAFLADRRTRIASLRGTVLPAFVVIGGLAALVGVEDFGTAALLAVVGGGVLLAAGCPVRFLLAGGVPAVAGSIYLISSESYRWQRITGFFHIWDDPQGAGYHPIQSLATIASGGWFGQGLGAGIQKYGYLPASQTDFVFAVLCEETGFVGGLAVIGLFVTLAWLGLQAMRCAEGAQARLLALGVTLLIGVQAVMNIAVVTVVAPTKGIALPFVSAGGSSLLFLSVLVGLLAGVARGGAREPISASRPREAPWAHGGTPSPATG